MRYCLFGFFFLRDFKKRSFLEKCVRFDLALILERFFLISGHKASPTVLYLWTDKFMMPDTFKNLKKFPILSDLIPINAHQLQ